MSASRERKIELVKMPKAFETFLFSERKSRKETHLVDFSFSYSNTVHAHFQSSLSIAYVCLNIEFIIGTEEKKRQSCYILDLMPRRTDA